MSRGKTFLYLAIGAAVALVFNGMIAGILNKVLSPIGLTYA
jgi:hypothetical protein